MKYYFKEKNVEFSKTKIILKCKSGQIEIPWDSIIKIDYCSNNLIYYLLIWGLSCPPGHVLLFLKTEIYGRKKYLLKIKRQTIQKFPERLKAGIIY